jgi:hypothetical protein
MYATEKICNRWAVHEKVVEVHSCLLLLIQTKTAGLKTPQPDKKLLQSRKEGTQNIVFYKDDVSNGKVYLIGV